MTVLLYGVAPASAHAPTGDGLGDRPLRVVGHDGLHAVINDVDQPPSPHTDNLWAYERVIERLMQTDAVLPARFGTTAEDDDDVLALLIARHAQLTDILHQVRGAVEFAVHNGEPQSEKPKTGTEYMTRLLERDQGLRPFDEQVAEVTRAKRRRGSSTAYLVEQAGAEEFVRQAGAQNLVVTGPWPPYSFVGDDAS